MNRAELVDLQAGLHSVAMASLRMAQAVAEALARAGAPVAVEPGTTTEAALAPIVTLASATCGRCRRPFAYLPSTHQAPEFCSDCPGAPAPEVA